MPRLNIEDELDSDVRFQALIAKLGDAEKAFGKLIRFWRCAQDFWGRESLVPEDRFRYGEWDVLIDVGLAERRADGVYARGAEERFKWYLDLCRKNRRENAKRKDSFHEPVRAPAGPQAGPVRGPSLLSTLKNTPTECMSEPPVPDVPAAPSVPTPRELAVLWNGAKAAVQPAVNLATFKSGSRRWKTAMARLSFLPDLEFWRQVIERIAASPFCRGETGSTWVANFDWLVKPETHVKVTEGQYDARPMKRASGQLYPVTTEADFD